MDLTGTNLQTITAPLGQDLVIDLGPFTDRGGATVTVSGWTWLGQVRLSPTSAVLATLAFTASTDSTRRLATLAEADLTALGVGRYCVGIDQVTPTKRQVAYTTSLIVVDDFAR